MVMGLHQFEFCYARARRGHRVDDDALSHDAAIVQRAVFGGGDTHAAAARIARFTRDARRFGLDAAIAVRGMATHCPHDRAVAHCYSCHYSAAWHRGEGLTVKEPRDGGAWAIEADGLDVTVALTQDLRGRDLAAAVGIRARDWPVRLRANGPA